MHVKRMGTLSKPSIMRVLNGVLKNCCAISAQRVDRYACVLAVRTRVMLYQNIISARVS